MLRIVNAQLHRIGQNFLDEVWDMDNVPTDPRDARISPEPHGEQGIINEDNYEQFEPFQAEQEPKETFLDEIPDEEDMFDLEPVKEQEIVYTGQKPYTMRKLVYDGIDNQEIISFEYINRFNQPAGTRTVQPHYTFMAETTGNEVLVSWDMDKNAIRAFIVGNIHPYGVRYEDVKFNPRGEIMRGIY